MATAPPRTIAEVAPTLADLKQLSKNEQGVLLLKRLGHLYPRQTGREQLTFFKGNLAPASFSPDPGGLATGYPREEVRDVVLHLLGAPWQEIERNYYISSLKGNGWYEITEEGWSEVEKSISLAVPNRTAIDALEFLHKDLQGYGHYFRERKLKEAVAAAFKRVENRLNEIRDSSKVPSAVSVSGVSLPHKLYDSGDLKFPFPTLGASNQRNRDAYSQSLKSFLSSGIGWFRNAFDHEPHNLPDLDEAEALELLFVASAMLRIIDKSS